MKQFFHGDEYSKLDFCDEMELKKKYKVLTIFDTKIKKNFSQYKQLKNFKEDYISIKILVTLKIIHYINFIFLMINQKKLY